MKYYVYFGCFDSHYLREFETREAAQAQIDEELQYEHYKENATIRLIEGEEIE